MRKLTYLLTGTLLFTSIIIGCEENKSPSSPDPTSHQPTGNQSALIGSDSSSIDAYPIANIQNAPIKNWGIQFNADNTVTALSYGTDIFTLQKTMMTSDEYPILISNNALTNNSISILKFIYKSENNDVLIGQMQTVTHPDVIQEIRDFINDVDEDDTLNSYTEIENSEKVDFNISFYKASYTVEHQFSFFSSAHVSFRNRNPQAYMMIADTAVGEERQIGVNIAIISNSNPSTIAYQEPLHLSFQQPYGAFLTNSNTTGLIEGLDIEGLDPLTMNVDTTTDPISFSFNQTLSVNDQEKELQITVTSDMEPLYFKTPVLNQLSRAFTNTLEVAEDALYSDTAQNTLIAALTYRARLHNWVESKLFPENEPSLMQRLGSRVGSLFSGSESTEQVTQDNNPASQQVDSENETGFIQSISSFFSSENDTTEAVQEIDWNEVYQTSQRVENEAGFIQSVKSFFSSDNDTTDVVQEIDWNEVYQTSQQVDNEAGFIQSVKSFFSSENDTTDAVQEIDWNEVYQTSQRVENEEGFIQSVKSFFSSENDTTDAVQEIDWNEVYQTSQRVENEEGFIQSVKSFFSSENDTTDVVQEIDWNEVYQTSQRIDNEEGFIQWARSLFSGGDNTDIYEQNAENVKSFSRDEIYTRGLPTAPQDNTPTPPSIDRAEDQTQPLVPTSPQQALREFEERNAHVPSIPILRFAEEMTVISPEDPDFTGIEQVTIRPSNNCDAIYAQEGLTDNYRTCARAATELGSEDFTTN